MQSKKMIRWLTAILTVAVALVTFMGALVVHATSTNEIVIYSIDDWKEAAESTSTTITIKLGANLDVEGESIPSLEVGGDRTFDGQGYTIKNVGSEASPQTVSLFSLSLSPWGTPVQNVTLENVIVAGEGNHGILFDEINVNGLPDSCNFNNVKIINCSVTSNDAAAGAIIGRYSTSSTTCNLNGVLIRGTAVTAASKAGGLIGDLYLDNDTPILAKNLEIVDTTVSVTAEEGYAAGLFGYVFWEGNNCSITVENAYTKVNLATSLNEMSYASGLFTIFGPTHVVGCYLNISNCITNNSYPDIDRSSSYFSSSACFADMLSNLYSVQDMERSCWFRDSGNSVNAEYPINETYEAYPIVILGGDVSPMISRNSDGFINEIKSLSWGNWSSYDETQHVRTCTCCETVQSFEDHIWGEWTVTKTATCTEEGTRTRNCTSCGYVVTEAIAKTAHTKNTVEAVDDTHHHYVCACGYEFENTLHSWRSWTVTKEATCTEEGSRQRSCIYCGYVATEAIAKLSHTKNTVESVDDTHHHYVCTCGYEWASEPHNLGTYQMQDDAQHYQICSTCSHFVFTNHSWSCVGVIKSATFDEDGSELWRCVDCTAEKTVVIPKLSEDPIYQNLLQKIEALENAQSGNPNELSQAITNLNAAIDAAKAAAENADTALKVELLASIESAKSALEAKIAEVQENLDKAIEDLEAADQKNADDLAAAITNLNNAIDEAEAAAEGDNDALKVELLASIESAKSALEAKIAEVQENLDKAIEDLEAADKKNADDLAAAITNLNNAIDAAEAAAENDNAALKSELLATIAAAKGELSAAIAQVQQNLDDAKAALDAADQKNADDLAKAITDLTAAIDAAEVAAQTADAALKAELEGAIAVAKSELSAANSAVQKNLDDTKLALEQRITELENQVEIESEKTKMYIIVVGVIGGFGIIASLGIALLSLLKKKN